MKKVAIYIRVSSDKQIEGDSIPAQRAALRKYIDDKPDLSFFAEYMDDGISGTKYSQRDELQRLLDDVSAGSIDLIIFTKLDRWFRSVRHYTATQEILDKHNVAWTAIWEPIYDTSTPQGRLIVNQMMSIAQFEAENTGQRIRQVQAYKLTQKEVISGSTPPGYAIKNKHLTPNKDAENVIFAFKEYSRTGCMSDALRYTSGMSGIPRSRPSFKRMLKNPIYIGRHPSGINGFCPPIIEKHLWDDVQRKLAMNIKSSQKQVYIFSGLIRCAECGVHYGANTRRRKRGNCSVKEVHQYRCPHHYNYKPPLCDNAKIIYETALEKHLIQNLKDLTKNAIFKYEAKAAPAKDRTAQISALKKKVDRLKELFVNDLITLEEYKKDKEQYLKQVEVLETEQQKFQLPHEEAVSGLKALANADIGSIYNDLTIEEKRRFWRGIISSISIDKDRKLDIEFVAFAGHK